MELREYLAILKRRKWVIVVTFVVALAATLAGTLMMTPRYEASATLRVATATSGSVEWVNYAVDYTDRLMNTYSRLATTTPVLQELQNRLNLEEPPQFEVEILANTELMQIHAEDQDPVLAAAVANALADILIEQSSALNPVNRDGPLAALQATTTLSVIDPAAVPERPSKPNKIFNIALGFVVGSVGGLGLAFLFENLDTTLYTPEQIEQATGLAVLGQVPMAKRQRYLASQEEAFRRLRTNILTHGHDIPRTLMVTSSEPGEGKSTVAVNLGMAMAQSGQRVLVVDGNLRAPSLHTFFDLPNDRGLSSVLAGKVALAEAVQDGPIPCLRVLTSGQSPDNPYELLGSSRMAALLEQLRQQFDQVLVDAPALLAVADAVVLAPHVDGVVLVVGCARARGEAVQAASRQLAAVNAKLAGVVVNRAVQQHRYDDYQGKAKLA